MRRSSLEMSCDFLVEMFAVAVAIPSLGGRKSLPKAENHLKPSQKFSEQVGPSTHKMNCFYKTSHQKVDPNFAKNLGRQVLGNTSSGPNQKRPSLRLVAEVPCGLVGESNAARFMTTKTHHDKCFVVK